MNLGVIYIHGWGFDNYFWTGVHDLLSPNEYRYYSIDYFDSEKKHNVQCLDRNLFDLHSKKWLVICHSYGLTRFIRCYINDVQMQQNIIGIVSIAGFLEFIKNNDNPYGVDALILHKMIKKFRHYPLQVLHDFHQQCEFLDPYYLKSVIRTNEKAYEDLKNLITVDETSNIKKIKLPFLILAAENDAIVSKNISRSLHNTLHNSQLLLRENGGHGLGFNHPQWCAEQIKKFVRGLSNHG
jgi:pimeloyl-ACP methyl ester carboxylesterase